MSTGYWHGKMCCICFAGVTLDNAWRDPDGQAWDLCSVDCAIEAGAMSNPIPPGVRHPSRTRPWRGPVE